MMLSLNHYLVVGAIMFTIGLFGALSKRHAISVIISIELMLNAVNINFVAFCKYMMGGVGEVMAIFVIALAAAEVAIGLAICVVLFRNRENIDLDRYNILRF